MEEFLAGQRVSGLTKFDADRFERYLALIGGVLTIAAPLGPEIAVPLALGAMAICAVDLVSRLVLTNHVD